MDVNEMSNVLSTVERAVQRVQHRVASDRILKPLAKAPIKRYRYSAAAGKSKGEQISISAIN